MCFSPVFNVHMTTSPWANPQTNAHFDILTVLTWKKVLENQKKSPTMDKKQPPPKTPLNQSSSDSLLPLCSGTEQRMDEISWSWICFLGFSSKSVFTAPDSAKRHSNSEKQNSITGETDTHARTHTLAQTHHHTWGSFLRTRAARWTVPSSLLRDKRRWWADFCLDN